MELAKFCEPAKHLNWWVAWGQLFLGCLFMAAAFVYFINPYKLTPGGVYGASIALHNIFPNLQVGTFGYMFDVPLLILSLFLLGLGIGVRTIVAALSVPAIMNVMTHLSYPTKEAIEKLDPSVMLGGVLDLSNHMLLAVVIGAVITGVGSGLIIRSKATSGGTDLIAMIMQKFLRIPYSTSILFVDAIVVVFGLIVIGFGVGSKQFTPGETTIYLSLYSLVEIFICSRTVKFVLNGTKDDKIIFVVTGERPKELHQFILEDLDRTATVMEGSGIYTQTPKEVLMLVVSNREVLSVTKKIKDVDPKAFVIVTDAYDAYGEGWKTLPEKDEIAPE